MTSGSTGSTVLRDGGTVSRLGGLTEVTVWFAEAIDPATVVPGCVSITSHSGCGMSSLISDLQLDDSRRKLTVSLAGGLPDADRYTFALTDLLRTAGGAEVASSITVNLLAGDADCSGVVTRADMLAVRQAAGQPLNSDSIHLDVNDSGVVTAADMLAVRSRLGRSLPEP